MKFPCFDATARIPGKTCDMVVDEEDSTKCGKPACQEFASHDDSIHGFLCAEHAAAWWRSATGSQGELGPKREVTP